MKTIVKFILTPKEVREMIPFAPLAECENKLNTGRAKRLMYDLGITQEMLDTHRAEARKWYLVTGFPDDYEFTEQELKDWDKIGQLVFNL